jgi:hypothetical protein
MQREVALFCMLLAVSACSDERSPQASIDDAAVEGDDEPDDSPPADGKLRSDGGGAGSKPGPSKDGAAPRAPSVNSPDAAKPDRAKPDAARPDGAVPGGEIDAGSAPDVASDQAQLAVSADFLNQTLSIFDVGKLAEGKKRADVLVGSVDLSKYTPGPLALGITPDGKTALVSISAGFIGAFIDVPPGPGTLVFVDLETRMVTGELAVGDSPMGIIISPDGKRAFVGLYGETYFAVVDIEKRTFEKVRTGSQYNEELAIDDTGTVGILTYGPTGNAKTFSIADPAGTLGQTSGLSGDAAGTAFFPGTKIAYLLQAPTALTGNVGGHNLVNVEDPKKPITSDNVRMSGAPTTYPVVAVGPRKSVAFPATKDGMLSIVEMKLEGSVAKEAQRVAVAPVKGLAYGVSSTPDGRVLTAVSGEHLIGVVDLESKKAFTVPWEVTKSGPMDIKMIPRR